MRELPLPSHPIEADVNSISSNGDVFGGCVCTTRMHALLWRNGRMIDLGIPKWAEGGDANVLTNDGTIVCTVLIKHPPVYSRQLPKLLSAPAVLRNGQWQRLPTYANYCSVSVIAANSNGVIVGDALKSAFGRTFAVIWYAGRIYDLNSLIPAQTRWSLTEAIAINDSGAIVANGYDKAKREVHALLLRPEFSDSHEYRW